MTKEQFQQEMLKWVTYHKEKLEQADLRRAKLPSELSGKRYPVTYNPFLEIDEKYFNIRILSNVEGLNTLINKHPELRSNEITLFIIGNPKFKVLNQMLNYNTYLVNELKGKIHSPMDIAIAYAQHCQARDGFEKAPKC